MTATNRSYPDISFVETDTEAIVNALIQSYEKFTGRTLYPADPARLFILWVADIIVQERVNIDFSAKQNVPRYAEGEYLDSLAELFKDTYRLEPEKAKTTLRYTLSIKLDTATVIPAGTRATPHLCRSSSKEVRRLLLPHGRHPHRKSERYVRYP